ncbi:MAG: hypothetical protein ABIH23_22300 [bacterium]
MNHKRDKTVAVRGLALAAFVLLPVVLGFGVETGTADNTFKKIDSPFLIDGKPVLGTYISGHLPIEDYALLKELGMNLIIGGKEHVDIETPVGEYLYDNKIRVLYHLTHSLYSAPRIGDAITPDQTTIPLENRKCKALKSPGVVLVDNELIRYEKYTPAALEGCERGYGGTTPAAHHSGIILFDPEEAEKEVASVMNSPNLWGYYTLDDSPGDAISALRGLYRAIRRVDHGPIYHPVLAGYGSGGSTCNFGPEVCDMMLIYLYPLKDSGFNEDMITMELQWMLTAAREQVPHVPFVAVYQAYWGQGAGKEAPTPEQIRRQFEDFTREGVSGFVAFIYSGILQDRPMQETIKEIHTEILDTGGLQIPPQGEDVRRSRVQPLDSLDDPSPIPGVIPEYYVIGPFANPAEGGLGTIHPPEKEFKLDAAYEGKAGTLRWQKRRTEAGFLGFQEIVGFAQLTGSNERYTANSTAYALCTVTSPREQKAWMRVGSDDDAIVWLGKEEIYRFEGTRGISERRDDDIVPVILPRGKTRILVKSYNRGGMWGFFMRFTDEDGGQLPGVEFSLPQ